MKEHAHSLDPRLPVGCTLVHQPDATIMEQVYRFRVAAWHARVPAFPDMEKWRDDFDDGALHWAVIVSASAEPQLLVPILTFGRESPKRKNIAKASSMCRPFSERAPFVSTNPEHYGILVGPVRLHVR